MRVVLWGLGLLFAVTTHAADIGAGKSSYNICTACHGPLGAGNQALNAPRIAGQYDWYLKRQLKAFKDGIRGGPGDMFGAQMRPMAMSLNDDTAIDNVVAYIATLNAPPPQATVQGDANLGKQLYETCAACHGQKAEGIPAQNAPKLADQDDWYLVRQLQNYKSGVRGSNPKDAFGAQMKPMAAMLANDDAIKNVVVYIRSLK